jgi:hypothetical protein
VTAGDKEALRTRLKALDDELNQHLAAEYGVPPRNPKAFDKWLASHKPFHWFVEFYGIMSKGGFDVIIGNPPWTEYSSVRKDYTVRDYVTERCGNLHCLCTERALTLRGPSGYMSFIVQLPMANSSRMASVRNLLRQESGALYVVPFDDRPGKLFEGLEHCRSVIFVSQANRDNTVSVLHTAAYQRWASDVRAHLFPTLHYTDVKQATLLPGIFPKYARTIGESLLMKTRQEGHHRIGTLLSTRPTPHFVFYQEATGYWVKASIGLPYYARNGQVGAPAHGRYLYFAQEPVAHAVSAILNSSLFYYYFIVYGDCFHLSDTLVSTFAVPSKLEEDSAITEAGSRLARDMRDMARRTTITTTDGYEIAYDEYFVWKSKPIIDDIDRVLAEHYGFTDEELDFIINYDIKYRMGAEEGVEE